MHAFPSELSPRTGSLESFLETGDAGKIIEHARLLSRLSRIYQTIVPAPLGKMSQLVNYTPDKAVLHTPSPAAATKLRQLAPTIADSLSQRGYQCNRIQIKVQAIETEKDSLPPPRNPMSAETLKTIEGLRNALPESALRAALGNLIAHQKTEN
jgi:hypothetical protein